MKPDILSSVYFLFGNGARAILTPRLSSGCAVTQSTSVLPVTLESPNVGKVVVNAIEVNGVAVPSLLTMIKPAAPAAWAYFCLSAKVSSPRLTMAILPLASAV